MKRKTFFGESRWYFLSDKTTYEIKAEVSFLVNSIDINNAEDDAMDFLNKDDDFHRIKILEIEEW